MCKIDFTHYFTRSLQQKSFPLSAKIAYYFTHYFTHSGFYALRYMSAAKWKNILRARLNRALYSWDYGSPGAREPLWKPGSPYGRPGAPMEAREPRGCPGAQEPEYLRTSSMETTVLSIPYQLASRGKKEQRKTNIGFTWAHGVFYLSIFRVFRYVGR